ncbi:hypothetical protein [Streptomyces sp. NK15101]|uniref:hypothetical protein n=1 Tax=Streptomyces sp. NK15101 TaxID=2873261 RepID=UPI001CECF9FC|nr:hypothetical protein [Streptomyces sp. NK15101]
MTAVVAAAISLAVPGAASAQAAPASTPNAPSLVNCGTTLPWLSPYEFGGRLHLNGGCFTLNRHVFLVVKYNNGTIAFKKWVFSKNHPNLAGGWVNTATGLKAPCAGPSNGYARGYDEATDRWSPRVPVTIGCVAFD